MDKETKWLKARTGLITASELAQITSASGKIIDGNIDYIRKKRWERKHGFAHHTSARPMDIGNEQEPYIYAWLCAYLGTEDIVYSKNLPEIPLWIAPDCPLGASPDAFTADERLVFEFKTLVGAKQAEFFDDDGTPYEDKRTAVWKEHGEQILGQFISNDKVEEIWLIKYIYCDDDIMEDTDSPLALWRGHIFKFFRHDLEELIADMKDRIRLFDAMIDSKMNPSEFKEGKWGIDNEGKLYKK